MCSLRWGWLLEKGRRRRPRVVQLTALLNCGHWLVTFGLARWTTNRSKFLWVFIMKRGTGRQIFHTRRVVVVVVAMALLTKRSVTGVGPWLDRVEVLNAIDTGIQLNC